MGRMTEATTMRPDIGCATDLGDVLSVWAHPDDETYLAGGLMAALRDAGHRVVCVTATRGEAADPRATPGERDALAEVRTAELERALTSLGVEEHHWLDLPDGACAGLDPAPPVARLVDLLDELRPHTVLTFGPDGFTGHPDHSAAGAWAAAAVEGSSVRPRLLHAVSQVPAVDPALDDDFGVFELGRPRFCEDDELALRLQLTGPALDRKVRALLHQESQTGALVEAAGLERFARWVATEAWAPPALATSRA